MAAPILELGNLSYLQEVYETTLTAGSSPVPGYHVPIPRHLIPATFTRHTLLVGASSSTAKPNWRMGFYLSMAIASGVGLAESDSYKVPFGLNIIRLPMLSNEFKLKAYIPKWHQEMTMKIWQYTGPEADALDLLTQVKLKTDTL